MPEEVQRSRQDDYQPPWIHFHDEQAPDAHEPGRGFSLVELLVSLAVIAALIALLLPALSAAAGAGRDVACLSNLRQVGLGSAAYAVDHGGEYTPFGATHRLNGDATAGDAAGPGWMERLGGGGYLPAPEPAAPGGAVWNCPRFPEAGVTSYFLSARWLWLRERSSLVEADLRVPAEFLLAGDCTRAGSYAAPLGTAVIGFDDVDKDDAMAESWLPGARGGIDLHEGRLAGVAADGNAGSAEPDAATDFTLHPAEGRVAWSGL